MKVDINKLAENHFKEYFNNSDHTNQDDIIAWGLKFNEDYKNLYKQEEDRINKINKFNSLSINQRIYKKRYVVNFSYQYIEYKVISIDLINENKVLALNISEDKEEVLTEFLLGSEINLPDFEPETIKPEELQNMVKKEYNYYFKVGEMVKFVYDPNNIYPKIMYFEGFENKVGKVYRCWSDMHSFGSGSYYLVMVNFDGIIITKCAESFERI